LRESSRRRRLVPNWNLIVAFALAVVALCLVPGPDMLFVLTDLAAA
jgi:threonine/homoserine/homoserine lactone efflux protein